MRVSLDTSQWDRALAELGKGNAIKAGIRAVNRTASNAKTAMVKVVSSDMGLKQKTVRDRIFISTAKPSEQAPKAVLSADSRKIPLIEFGAKGRNPSRGKGAGVRAKLLAPGAGTYPHAFIATMPSGHTGVFERSKTKFMRPKAGRGGKPRQAIYELPGPSIAHVFTKNAAVAEARAIEMLTKNMDAEIKYLLLKAKQ